ncbi:MAG: 5'/3'-nucleotidase SurE [Lentisphaeraceae bacterium]|nr:5'/3'-nucleotidase SurE [Lentisphaeraceae bacterium]
MNILLSNDDGSDSPLFHILYDCLTEAGHNVTAILPASEQSWTAKSMSRFGKLHCQEHDDNGRVFYTFSGTPADCVNFGIYHVCDQKPDLVISGINLGYNVGLAYILSSGTVGAAMEGNLAGLPAISFSQSLPAEIYKEWNLSRSMTEEAYSHFKNQFRQILDKLSPLFDVLINNRELWTIEIPGKLKGNWQIKEAGASKSFYGCAFRKNEDGSYQHASPSLTVDEDPKSDLNIMSGGDVSLCKINLSHLTSTGL